jgi:hypothetical protein
MSSHTLYYEDRQIISGIRYQLLECIYDYIVLVLKANSHQ